MYRRIFYLTYLNRSANSISDSTCLKNNVSNMVTVHINILLKTLSKSLNSEVTKYGEVWRPVYFINDPIPRLSAREWGQRLNNFSLWLPHRMRSHNMFKSGDRVGHPRSPLKNTTCLGNNFLSTFRKYLSVFVLAQTCGNHNSPWVLGMKL